MRKEMVPMNRMNWKEWLRAALIRAVKTFCQGLATLIGTDMVNIVDLNWPQMIGVSATMALLSILTSVAGLPEVDDTKIYDKE